MRSRLVIPDKLVPVGYCIWGKDRLGAWCSVSLCLYSGVPSISVLRTNSPSSDLNFHTCSHLLANLVCKMYFIYLKIYIPYSFSPYLLLFQFLHPFISFVPYRFSNFLLHAYWSSFRHWGTQHMQIFFFCNTSFIMHCTDVFDKFASCAISSNVSHRSLLITVVTIDGLWTPWTCMVVPNVDHLLLILDCH